MAGPPFNMDLTDAGNQLARAAQADGILAQN